jgi:hypothetical protein
LGIEQRQAASLRMSDMEKFVKKYLFVVALLVPMFTHAACQCEDDQEEDDDGIYREYDYLGLKGGTVHYQAPGALGISNSYGLYYGHRYSKLFAVELEYSYLGKYRDTTSSGHATAVSLSGVHYYDLTNTFALVGKLGIGFTHTGNVPVMGKNAVDFNYGAGFDWRIAREWHLRALYEHYVLKMPESAGVANTYVGFAYRY